MRIWDKNCISICERLNKLRYKIEEIFFYVFSTENWKRSLNEISDSQLIEIFIGNF